MCVYRFHKEIQSSDCRRGREIEIGAELPFLPKCMGNRFQRMEDFFYVPVVLVIQATRIPPVTRAATGKFLLFKYCKVPRCNRSDTNVD